MTAPCSHRMQYNERGQEWRHQMSAIHCAVSIGSVSIILVSWHKLLECLVVFFSCFHGMNLDLFLFCKVWNPHTYISGTCLSFIISVNQNKSFQGKNKATFNYFLLPTVYWQWVYMLEELGLDSYSESICFVIQDSNSPTNSLYCGSQCVLMVIFVLRRIPTPTWTCLPTRTVLTSPRCRSATKRSISSSARWASTILTLTAIIR